ncbi:MAG: hypothetical protein IGS03_07965 [Candidatus Sericytochromatia bacterium]|nr:hypothetical protein [Candidatus Sericytochromatia bacterium]
MAIASERLIDVLRQTVVALKDSDQYQWGHSGACNCGHLAQVLTGYDKAQIHYWAMQKGGDWTDNAGEYCDSSGYEIDRVIEIMLQAGLQIEDIQDIENLSNPRVLRSLPPDQRQLQRHLKADVVKYFEAWIHLLQSELDGQSPQMDWVASRSEPQKEVVIYDSVPELVLKS